MQFASHAEREAYFERGEAAPGSWLEHAVSTNLGIYGNSESLLRDCAIIAAAEIAGLTGHRPEPEAVTRAPAFQRAFDTSRAIAEERLRDGLSALLPPADGEEPHPILQALGHPSMAISLEDKALWANPGAALGERIAREIASELGTTPRPRF